MNYTLPLFPPQPTWRIPHAEGIARLREIRRIVEAEGPVGPSLAAQRETTPSRLREAHYEPI